MKWLMVMICLLVFSFLGGCGEDDSADEQTSVSLTFATLLLQETTPDTLTLTVVGEGMAEITAETKFVRKEARIDFLTIPSGPSRIFTLEIRDKNGTVLYRGQITQDLKQGKTITISIPIKLVAPEITGKDHTEMVLIPAGEFWMGSRAGEIDDFGDKQPRHKVYLDAFYIDKHEVTVGQYKRFLKETTYTFSSDAERTWDAVNLFSPTDEHPITHVNWFDAMAYARWAGKTLPTEAQWEKAARGRLEGKMFPWGDSVDRSKANYHDPALSRTTPVGEYPPNGYGLYDMAGNVWEWCMDEYQWDYYSRSPKNNPVAGGILSLISRVGKDFVDNFYGNVRTERVYRGGSWRWPADHVRVAFRNRELPWARDPDLGFRCVKNLGP